MSNNTFHLWCYINVPHPSLPTPSHSFLCSLFTLVQESSRGFLHSESRSLVSSASHPFTWTCFIISSDPINQQISWAPFKPWSLLVNVETQLIIWRRKCFLRTASHVDQFKQDVQRDNRMERKQLKAEKLHKEQNWSWKLKLEGAQWVNKNVTWPALDIQTFTYRKCCCLRTNECFKCLNHRCRKLLTMQFWWHLEYLQKDEPLLWTSVISLLNLSTLGDLCCYSTQALPFNRLPPQRRCHIQISTDATDYFAYLFYLFSYLCGLCVPGCDFRV